MKPPRNLAPTGQRLAVTARAIAALMLMSILAAPAAAQAAPAVAMTEGRAQALQCLTDAIAYEAGTEPAAGQQAVAQVVLNRVRSAGYPKTVCGVIFEGAARATGCQFTFTCDGSLRRRIPLSLYAAARTVAQSALDGTMPDRVGRATNYHAYYVAPAWAGRLNRIGRIGAHIFYGAGGPIAWTGPAASPSPSRHPLAAQPVLGPHFAPWGLAGSVESGED
jgi:spore germination cell wall hydrolase CwlJ-like protein